MSAETLETVDFDELVGQELDFYGCQGNRFRLDDKTYEFVEHENGSYEITDAKAPIEGLPIARVVIEHPAFGDDSYEITDLHDAHEWLSFGAWTFIDDVEPYFEYSPKAQLT